MSRARLLPAALAAAALAVTLTGCISLFPKQAPAQLYRFGVPLPTAADGSEAGDTASRVSLVSPPVTVAPSASTDRMLAITGTEAAFIGGARWVSPAAVLWDQAARRAFAARSTRVRLLTRNEFAGGAAFLRLDVPEFETRYAAPGAAPIVHVALHALLTHRSGVFSAEHAFVADAPAADNRVGPIVDAYNVAVSKALDAAVAWTDAQADAAAVDTAPVLASRTTSTSTTTTVSVPPPRPLAPARRP